MDDEWIRRCILWIHLGYIRAYKSSTRRYNVAEAAWKIIYLPFINEFHFSNFLIKNQFSSVLVI